MPGFLDTNEIFHTAAAELLEHGLSQAFLADCMKLSPSWFNRWINTKDARVLSTSAQDAFLLFLHRLQRTAQTAIEAIEEAPKKARTEPSAPPKRRQK